MIPIFFNKKIEIKTGKQSTSLSYQTLIVTEILFCIYDIINNLLDKHMRSVQLKFNNHIRNKKNTLNISYYFST